MQSKCNNDNQKNVRESQGDKALEFLEKECNIPQVSPASVYFHFKHMFHVKVMSRKIDLELGLLTWDGYLIHCF
jgi:hypothetical protein